MTQTKKLLPEIAELKRLYERARKADPKMGATELARRVGIHRRQVYHIFGGEYAPNLKTFLKMKQVLEGN